MSEDGLLTRYTATVAFDRYEDIRTALFDPNLSRTFDKRSYHGGNIRDGIVSIAHGATHRARRRVENTQFRAEVLRLYERDLFPTVMNELLDTLITRDRVDLFPIGEMLSVVLAARRAGIELLLPADDDPETLQQLADQYGISREAIRVAEKKLIAKLKKYMIESFGDVREIEFHLST